MADSGRAAVFGLLGALVGGAASFGGSYFTVHRQETAAELATQRAAYVDVASKFNRYMIDQNNLLDVAPRQYPAGRRQLLAEVASLDAATTLVRLLGPDDVGDRASAMEALAFKYAMPLTQAELNGKKLDAAYAQSEVLLNRFFDAAKQAVSRDG